MKSQIFDVIVVGGGHAGIEAAHAAAKMGSKTVLISLRKDRIGHMPCNPAVGGIGKGHIVFEISALGGVMPRLCTKTYLQAKMLNTKKGPAVQGLRLQIDKYAYARESQQFLSSVPNLTILEDCVDALLYDDGDIKKIRGVKTAAHGEILAPSVVLTTGTFLQGLVHIGTYNTPAGRRDEQAVFGISPSLKNLGLKLGRLKTGTPPRLLESSVDFSVMQAQEDEPLSYLFEFYPHTASTKRQCYITHTNEKTHQIIRDNLHLSAMYNGNIKGIGPRYCPSIEDKIGRFPQKTSHHVFVEPEGAESDELYPNGLSTSLPEAVQYAYIRSIRGFENAAITKLGYAIEYDFVHPNQLQRSLETKLASGLFCAGQINGTTGYEEAAGQGIVAGINAHLKAHGKAPFILDRTESYIGIMIDDLVCMGVDEPYRMFTSRAERRLILRQDNVFTRLMGKAYELGLIDESLYRDFCAEQKIILSSLAALKKNFSEAELMNRFGNSPDDIPNLQTEIKNCGIEAAENLSDRALLNIHAEIRYAPYIVRELQEVKKSAYYKNLEIPARFVYENMPGLSKELQQKLKRHAPKTVADAALIPGMTPAAITLLIFKLRKNPDAQVIQTDCQI